jgi:lincosamide nucleotidyltransferase A/C/D/E
MTSQDVLEVLQALEKEEVVVWVDGGWGLAALVEREIRPHADLDLALDRASLDRAELTLARLGFWHDPSIEPGLPARFVLRDEHERQVDLHPLVFDSRGNGWQQLSRSGRMWGQYPADGLRAKGSINGQTVRCLSAGLQLRFHLGYEWTDRDVHDLRLLAAEFPEVSLPPTPWAAKPE